MSNDPITFTRRQLGNAAFSAGAVTTLAGIYAIYPPLAVLAVGLALAAAGVILFRTGK